MKEKLLKNVEGLSFSVKIMYTIQRYKYIFYQYKIIDFSFIRFEIGEIRQ